MSEWDEFILNSLQEKQHFLTTPNLVAIAKANPQNKLGEAQTKVQLNRSLQKLIFKKDLIVKVEKPGRGHYYALTEWVDEKGELPKKYARD